MEIYKKNFGVFLRHKLFAIAIPAYTLYQIAIIITEYLEIYGQGYPVLEYTRRILMLIPQIFVLSRDLDLASNRDAAEDML